MHNHIPVQKGRAEVEIAEPFAKRPGGYAAERAARCLGALRQRAEVEDVRLRRGERRAQRRVVTDGVKRRVSRQPVLRHAAAVERNGARAGGPGCVPLYKPVRHMQSAHGAQRFFAERVVAHGADERRVAAQAGKMRRKVERRAPDHPLFSEYIPEYLAKCVNHMLVPFLFLYCSVPRPGLQCLRPCFTSISGGRVNGIIHLPAKHIYKNVL